MKYILEQNVLSTTLSNQTLHISTDSTKGYTPLDLLISSIVGCSQIVFTQILEKKRISYDKLAIDVQLERAEHGAKQVEKVYLHYTITGDNLHQQNLEKALHLVPTYCTIAQSVKGSIDIIETIEVKEPTCG
jgi:putative redox protein